MKRFSAVRNVRVALLTLAMAGLAVAADSDFGLIGIASFENARLAAYCDGSVMPTPCAVTFEFDDIQGRVLNSATVTLLPGTGGFLDMPAAKTGLAGPVLIEPCFTVLRGVALASLEVFDTFTLRTRILINWGDRSVARQGDVDFGQAGITAFDTARIGAFCDGDGSVMPTPCDITFTFHDMQGNLLKQSQMILQPNTGGFVDLRWDETRSTARRVEIEPCFTVARGAAVGAFAIVDNFTGLTLAQAYPAAPATSTAGN